jgi:glycosyltransferase involved in cell wall biosynthesis
MKISVAIITYNEAHNILRCIEAAKKVSDNIIVVDSNSSDETCSIATNAGAIVVTRDFTGFGDQKNFAIQQTKYDWVLSLDADEVPSEQLILSIKKLDFRDNNVVYAVNRITNYCGKWIHHGGWYPDRKIRLWNKNFVAWEGSVHEKPIIPNGFSQISLKGDLLHYSYYSVAEHVRQAEKFSRMNAEKMFNKGKRTTYIQLYLAPCFKFLKSYIVFLGVLDGKYGFIIAKISAHATFLKHSKLLQLQKQCKI